MKRDANLVLLTFTQNLVQYTGCTHGSGSDNVAKCAVINIAEQSFIMSTVRPSVNTN